MVSYKHLFVFTLVLSCFALSSSDKVSDKEKYLDAHNKIRAKLKLKPLTWCDQLASYAKEYANKRKCDCELIHSDGTQYGENLDWCNSNVSVEKAVQHWIDEAADYDYNSNTCVPGKACGHYTQVVWNTTARVGCAKAMCDNGSGIFVTCEYDPPGNFVGEKPY